MIIHLSFVEGAHVEPVLVAVGHVLLVFAFLVECVLQGQHVPHVDLGRLHVLRVTLLHGCLERNVGGREVGQLSVIRLLKDALFG